MKAELIAIVAGSKDAVDRNVVYDALDALHPDVLLHGSLGQSVSLPRKGTDQLAMEWAHKRGVAYLVAPPLWDAYAKAAGPMRNKLVLWVGESLARTSGALLVVAALPGTSRAADNLVTLARERGIRVIEHGREGHDGHDGSVRHSGHEGRTSGGDQPGGGTWNR